MDSAPPSSQDWFPDQTEHFGSLDAAVDADFYSELEATLASQLATIPEETSCSSYSDAYNLENPLPYSLDSDLALHEGGVSERVDLQGWTSPDKQMEEIVSRMADLERRVRDMEKTVEITKKRVDQSESYIQKLFLYVMDLPKKIEHIVAINKGPGSRRG